MRAHMRLGPARMRRAAALAGALTLLPLVGCGVSTTSVPSPTTSHPTTHATPLATPLAGRPTATSTPASAPPPATASPPATAPTTTTSSAPPPPPTSPADIVNAYYAAINAGDYATAWRLGGDNFAGSYGQFVADFADTAEDSVEILATTATTVTIVLNATQTDGSVKTFSGTYTVNGDSITGASIRQVSTAPPPAAPVADLCGAPPNPYGYNLCGVGNLVTSPPSDICSYFSCIGNFDNGTGYMVECNDGTYSMSGGRPGACSYHGGESTPVSNGQ